jgi:hypothetical protein
MQVFSACLCECTACLWPSVCAVCMFCSLCGTPPPHASKCTAMHRQTQQLHVVYQGSVSMLCMSVACLPGSCVDPPRQPDRVQLHSTATCGKAICTSSSQKKSSNATLTLELCAQGPTSQNQHPCPAAGTVASTTCSTHHPSHMLCHAVPLTDALVLPPLLPLPR